MFMDLDVEARIRETEMQIPLSRFETVLEFIGALAQRVSLTSSKGRERRQYAIACKETRNVTTCMTNNQLGGSPILDLPVLILLILVLVITMHTTISQILYPSREPIL